MTTGADRIHGAAAVGYSAATDRYERGRPGYPAEAVDHLIAELGLSPRRTVLELGAGTGKLTSLIVPTGVDVVAVEPVASMRAALERACPTVRALDGTAEAIPLDDDTVDAVVVAQAFHWFDADRAVAEIHRVLRRGGRLGLIWNIRDETPAWSRRLTSIFDELSGEGQPRYKHGRWRDAFHRTDAFTRLEHRILAHVHEVTREGFLDRVLSVSYVASAPSDVRAAIVAEVTELLDTDPDLAGRARLAMPYRTDVFVCTAR